LRKLLSLLLEYNMIPELTPTKGTLGIPRALMPQISKDHQQSFFDQLKEEGIKIHKISMRAKDISPSQNEINSDKVDTWVIGKKPMVISSDNYILDGHHQWAKAMVEDEDMKLDCYKIELPIRKLLDYARNFEHTGYKDFHDALIKEHAMQQQQRLEKVLKEAGTMAGAL